MPYKPKKPCSHPGCPNLTGKQYCQLHASQANREYDQYRRRPDHNKLYGRRWKTIRDLYISKHPLCENCLKAGRYVPAEEVHHIQPLDSGGSNDDENLMSLCKSCHSSITVSVTNHQGSQKVK